MEEWSNFKEKSHELNNGTVRKRWDNGTVTMMLQERKNYCKISFKNLM